jgi:hypothetical protein
VRISRVLDVAMTLVVWSEFLKAKAGTPQQKKPDEPGGNGRCNSGQVPELDMNHGFDI